MDRLPRGPVMRPVAVTCGSFAPWNWGMPSSAPRTSSWNSFASSGGVPGPASIASTEILIGIEVTVSPSTMGLPPSFFTRPLQPGAAPRAVGVQQEVAFPGVLAGHVVERAPLEELAGKAVAVEAARAGPVGDDIDELAGDPGELQRQPARGERQST